MRQVPQYLLIGNGRVARHFRYYFSLLGLSFVTWQRGEPLEKLQQWVATSTHVLILITDQAIEEFMAKYLKNTSALCIHFSGSLASKYAYGAHPLMCFTPNLYTLEQYQTIPFVIDEDAPPFAELLPGLSNPHARLAKNLKAKYHALCVMSGNFSCLLWQKLFASLEQEFHLPKQFAYPYLQQQMQNLLTDSASALTGPLVRQDRATIEKNIAALAHDPFQMIYKSFVTAYQQLQEENTHEHI
jgi:predicted short-subunit dehydrogenase-like oxidoreductase (DUF2520 family)